jgi:hypothetical protein
MTEADPSSETCVLNIPETMGRAQRVYNIETVSPSCQEGSKCSSVTFAFVAYSAVCALLTGMKTLTTISESLRVVDTAQCDRTIEAVME